MKDIKKEEIQWDKRKILLFILASILLISVGLGLKTMLARSSKTQNPPMATQGVKGASSQNTAADIKKSVQDQISNLKTEAQNINLVDIASSSPQVQKVINDLKSIQNYPKNQLKNACEQICSGL